MNEQNNFLIAIVLCLGVLLGWQSFVVEPRLEAERQVLAQQAEAEVEKLAAQPADAAPATPDALPTPNAQAVPQVAGQRQAQPSDFAASQRVKIETEELQGSIALMGARFDDLILLEYVESTDPDAPRQRLLQRSGEAGAKCFGS